MVKQQNQANNQESGRFATLLINEYLSRAGYRRAPEQLMETAFPARAADADCLAFLAGSAVTAANNGIGVCLRYRTQHDSLLPNTRATTLTTGPMNSDPGLPPCSLCWSTRLPGGPVLRAVAPGTRLLPGHVRTATARGG